VFVNVRERGEGPHVSLSLREDPYIFCRHKDMKAIQTVSGNGALAIPRVIHRVWLGPDQVPAIFGHYAESWKKHHPAWEMRLWRDDTLPTLSCQAEYEKETAFKTRYDIVRLEILRQFGGVIVDMDVEAIRPLDPLLLGVEAFVGRISGRHIGNQVLGAVPHHPFFEDAVERLHSTANLARTSSEAAGKDFLRRLVTEHPEGVTIFPPETFYFQPSFEPPKRPHDFPMVFAVHHELESYAAPLPLAVIEDRFARLMREAAAVQAEMRRSAGVQLESSDAERETAAARLVDAQARQDRAERLLRRALSRQAHGYRAVLHRATAEREQAEARLARQSAADTPVASPTAPARPASSRQ
jgi:inositol phosphorylceramide mannosyltransferase catalytic subunit